MIKKIFILAVTASSTMLNATDSNSIKHYGYSAAFGFASETFIHKNYIYLDDIEKISYATILGTTPGLIKELSDKKFSKEDLAYDFFGALSGAVLSNYINNNSTIFISHDNKHKSTQIKYAYNF